MGLREDISSYFGLIFLLGLPFKTEILTLEIVTCKLLLLKRPTISQFFQFRFDCVIFFRNHLAPPSKGELMPKPPYFFFFFSLVESSRYLLKFDCFYPKYRNGGFAFSPD